MRDAAIDATPIDARECPPPPPSCTAFSCPSSNSCYYQCGTPTSDKLGWGDAQSSCEAAGLGCLVTIDNQAEQDCIAIQTMPMFPDALVWFGFRQSPSGAEPAGGWEWACGNSNYVSPAWGEFEPNNFGGNEDCGALTNSGGWIDADCSIPARYVCELP